MIDDIDGVMSQTVAGGCLKYIGDQSVRVMIKQCRVMINDIDGVMSQTVAGGCLKYIGDQSVSGGLLSVLNWFVSPT